MNFTKQSIEALPVTSKRAYYRDTDGSSSVRGLGLTVLPSGKKTFFVAATVDGKSRRIGLKNNVFPQMSVKQARDQAQAILSDIADGNDPVQERKEKRRVEQRDIDITLRRMLELYISEMSLKPATADQYRTRIKYEFETLPEKNGKQSFMDRPLTCIDKDVIQKINRERKAAASPALRTIKSIFNYCKVVYEDDGLFQVNPVDIIRKSRAVHKYGRKDTYIQAELFEQWFDAVDQQPTIYREYFIFLMLSGVRADSEAASLTWENVNFKTKSFKLLNTKNSRDIELPLPSYLYPLLKKREGKGSEKVFPIERCARPARLEIIEQSGVSFSRHDLRRSFLVAGESLDLSYLVIKRLANHSDNSSDTTAGYIPVNLERMRKASQKIETFILRKAKRLNSEVELFTAKN